MNKEKALKNQGLEFREDINLEGGTAMLRKLNCFLNIVIDSFIGVFIGFGIYNLRHTVS